MAKRGETQTRRWVPFGIGPIHPSHDFHVAPHTYSKTWCTSMVVRVMGTWVPNLPSGGDSYRFGGDVTQTIRRPIIRL
jgi:hypothetical protein